MSHGSAWTAETTFFFTRHFMPPSSLSNSVTHRANALHVAIIMDGNGRWASARGLPRSAGHRQGAEAVRQVVEAAPALGVHTLTLFAFSSDNWSRPPREVGALMRLFRAYLRSESARLAERGVRLSVIGRRDRLALPLRVEIERAERRTAGGSVLHLRLAIDYSARDALVRAASQCTTPEPLTGRSRARNPLTRDGFARHLAEAYAADANGTGSTPAVPDVDLMVRTGGEHRLSDFLLWECAYAELYFTNRMWPEFTAASLAAALTEFHHRVRRFGALPAAVAAG
jgi:undecaprenyl diphosphate synthase